MKEETPKTTDVKPDKIYSYKVFENNRLVNRSFKESEMTEEGAIHFYKKLAEQFNASPYAVKLMFIKKVAPPILEHFAKEETQMAIAAGNAVSDLTVKN